MKGAAKGRYQRKVSEMYNKTHDYHQDHIVHKGHLYSTDSQVIRQKRTTLCMIMYTPIIGSEIYANFMQTRLITMVVCL